MEKYDIKEVLGDGSFGTVYKALNTETGEIVAIKKMKKKFTNWDECRNLREVKSLIKLDHPHIMFLKEVLRVKEELFLVFEYLSANLYQTYQEMKKQGKTFNTDQIKSMVYQCASALAYMHKHGFFHRDLKPENILIHRDKAKLADFGLAREIRSKPPYTDYVSTRWYRAPELILKSTNYNSPVDIWALGCIMGELYLSTAMFMGNSEPDQLYKICSTLGTPSKESWGEGHRQASQIGVSFPQFSAIDLQTVIPTASPEAINLISEMLKFDPQKRITAKDILSHPYFYGFEPTPNILFNNSTPLPEPKKLPPKKKPANPKPQQQHSSPLKEDRKFDSEFGKKEQQQAPQNMNFSTPGTLPSKKYDFFDPKPTNTESSQNAGFSGSTPYDKDGNIDLEQLEKDLRETPTTEKNQFLLLSQGSKNPSSQTNQGGNSNLLMGHHSSDSASHQIPQSKSSNKLVMPTSQFTGGSTNTNNNNTSQNQYTSSLLQQGNKMTTFGANQDGGFTGGVYSNVGPTSGAYNAGTGRQDRWGGGNNNTDDSGLMGSRADRHSSLGRYNPNTDRISGVYQPDVSDNKIGTSNFSKSEFNKYSNVGNTGATGGTYDFSRKDRSPVRDTRSPPKGYSGQNSGITGGTSSIGGQNTITSPPKAGSKFKHEPDALTDFLNSAGGPTNMFKPTAGTGAGGYGSNTGGGATGGGKNLASQRFDSYTNFNSGISGGGSGNAGGGGLSYAGGGMSKSNLASSGSNANYFGSNVNLQMPVEDGFYGRFKS